MHLNSETAMQTCTQLPDKDIAIMSLRLTFGGRPKPSEWGAVSKTCIDLANAILQDPEWDPYELFSTNQHLVPPYLPLPDDTPFTEGKD